MTQFLRLILIGALLAAPATRGFADDTDPKAWSTAHVEDLFTLYKHLHQNPELSHQEKATAERIAQELESLGMKVTRNVNNTGVVAILENGPGPRIMVRTDLDALPVTEATGLAYASKVKVVDADGKETGVMHACGHDIHMTCLVGTARYMAGHKDKWSGTLMFIGQPAEETVGGADGMIRAGLFTRWPKPDYALALHVSPKLRTGSVGYRPGFALANVDTIDVTMYGRGGHGAQPHTTIDPIVIAAHLVVDLQSIIARELEPGDPAVITVGSIHGGTKHNIIADHCKLQLTVRSYADKTRQHLLTAIERKAKAAAAAAGAKEPKVEQIDGTPAMFNDEALVAKVVPVFKEVFGDENVELNEASMGGEDFSFYGKEGVPIFMFTVGTTDPERLAGYARLKQNSPSLHSPLYYPDPQPSIATGVTAMSSALLHLMPKAKSE
jgi:hippurate hydrolase